MKKMILAALTVLSATPAFAETFSCSFTEPFLSVTVDTEKGTGSIVSPIDEDTKTFSDLNVESFGNNKYRIAMGDQSLVIDLSKEGSDGMSDYVFPAEGILLGEARERGLIGGCESNLRKGHCPADTAGCR